MAVIAKLLYEIDFFGGEQMPAIPQVFRALPPLQVIDQDHVPLPLADERGKALGTLMRGRVFALTGKAADAVRAITSGMTSLRSTGASLYMNRGTCGTWQWLTRTLASLTMPGVALTTR
jgi:hypothetical protein